MFTEISASRNLTATNEYQGTLTQLNSHISSFLCGFFPFKIPFHFFLHYCHRDHKNQQFQQRKNREGMKKIESNLCFSVTGLDVFILCSAKSQLLLWNTYPLRAGADYFPHTSSKLPLNHLLDYKRSP